MKCRKIGDRRTNEREFEVGDALSASLVRNLYRCVDYQATDVMGGAVTFSGIAGDIVNALSNECVGKFLGEPDKNIKLTI